MTSVRDVYDDSYVEQVWPTSNVAIFCPRNREYFDVAIRVSGNYRIATMKTSGLLSKHSKRELSFDVK